MTFEHPQGLWLLALAAPVVAFHFYRGRVKRVPVPALLFWEQVIVEDERRTALRRLRHVASLLLSLLALTLLTAAASSPRFTAPRRWAVVLDTSASMSAIEDDGRTRLDRAVDLARDFLRSRALGDQAALHGSDGPAVPFTRDLEALALRLAAPPPARGAELGERVRAALAAGPDVTAVVFSDRPPPAADRVLPVRVGEPRENAGWVSGRLVRRPGEKRLVLELEAAHYGAGPFRREEVLRVNGRELARRPAAAGRREWDLDPAARPGAKLEEGGLVEVVLEPPDAMPADDVARFVAPPMLPPPVLVFHPGKPDDLLMHALTSLRTGGLLGEVNAAPAGRLADLRGRLGEGMIVVFDRVPPPDPPLNAAVLILGAPGPGGVEKPSVVDWDRDAAPARAADFGGLLLRRSRVLDGPPLIRAIEGTVATWSAKGGRAVVELGFALEDSDLAVRPAFLTLLFNLADWGAWRGLRSFAPGADAGAPLKAERPLWIDTGELLVEQGSRRDRVAVRGGRLDGAPAVGPGFLVARAGGREEWIAANLFDAGESDLRREAPPPSAPPPPAPWHARVPVAVPAILLVLALVVVEAWLFWRGLI
jgi:hypothetical protein